MAAVVITLHPSKHPINKITHLKNKLLKRFFMQSQQKRFHDVSQLSMYVKAECYVFAWDLAFPNAISNSITKTYSPFTHLFKIGG